MADKLSFSKRLKLQLSKLFAIGSGVMLSHLGFGAQAHAQITDGPYIFIEGEHLKAEWICEGKQNALQIPLKNLPFSFNQCGLDASIERLTPSRDALNYRGDFKVAAFSDLHGQYALTLELLKKNNIVDQEYNWQFGNGHLVITGDIFDRGDKVTELLWFFYRLEQQAASAGGQVHLLLGNHEVMILNGDLRYLHDKYKQVAKLLNTDFEQLYSENSVLGIWLRSKNVLVKINDTLFTHGGLHPELARQSRSLDEINHHFTSQLVVERSQRNGFNEWLHGIYGPIWYRGYFDTQGFATSEADIDKLLTHFNVRHIAVGHTSRDSIETRYQGKVLAIDTGMKRGKQGELLLIENGKHWRGTLTGKRLPISL